MHLSITTFINHEIITNYYNLECNKHYTINAIIIHNSVFNEMVCVLVVIIKITYILFNIIIDFINPTKENLLFKVRMKRTIYFVF